MRVAKHSPRRVAVAAPEVELIGEIGAHGVGSQAESIRQFETEVAERLGVQAQFVQLRADTRVRRRFEVVGANRGLNRRQPGGGIGDARPSPGLLDPGDRLRQIEVGIEYGFDDPIEYRVIE